MISNALDGVAIMHYTTFKLNSLHVVSKAMQLFIFTYIMTIWFPGSITLSTETCKRRAILQEIAWQDVSPFITSTGSGDLTFCVHVLRLDKVSLWPMIITWSQASLWLRLLYICFFVLFHSRGPGLADKNRNDHSIYIVCWKIWRHVFIPWVMINDSVQVIFSNSYFAILHVGADCIYVHYSEWKRSGIVNFIDTWMTWGLF